MLATWSLCTFCKTLTIIQNGRKAKVLSPSIPVVRHLLLDCMDPISRPHNFELDGRSWRQTSLWIVRHIFDTSSEKLRSIISTPSNLPSDEIPYPQSNLFGQYSIGGGSPIFLCTILNVLGCDFLPSSEDM